MSTKIQANRLDILDGPILKNLLLFALPLAASSSLQQLFNAADVAVVGKFASSQALAAVGSTTPITMLLLNLFIGLSIGSNVLISTLIGQQKRARISYAVHTSMLVAVISGFMILIIGIATAHPLLTLMGTPDDVMDLAMMYLRIYYLGMPFIMVFNFGAAVLRSIGDTRRPLVILIVTGFLNLFLNLFLVIGLHMSTDGVAIATVVSNVVSSVIVVILLIKEQSDITFRFSSLSIHTESLRRIVTIGAPAGIQSAIFSVSNIFIQSGVNSFGSAAAAGAAAALNFEAFPYHVIMAFSSGIVTFISQNYGACNYLRCKKVLRIGLGSGAVCTALLTTAMFLLRGHLLYIFTNDSNDVSYGLIRMTFVLAFQWIACSYEITGSALRGLGHSTLPTVLTILGSCAFRIIWLYTVFAVFHSFSTLMLVYPVSWIVTGSAVIIAYLFIAKKELC